MFVLIGGICYLISIVLLVLFVEKLNIEVNLANLLVSLIAIYIAYLLNGRFVFERGKHKPITEISSFYIYSLIGLGINVSLMYLMTTYTPIWYVISKTGITLFVAAFNFITRKFLVFNG